MNKIIQKLVNEYIAFNPAVLDDDKPKSKLPQDVLNDIIYYHPKDEKELRQYIRKLIAEGETDLNCIDTSEITDFSYLFSQRAYNWGIVLTTEQQISLDISSWDVSKGKNFAFMFEFCNILNSDITNWNVSSGEIFEYMFQNIEFFNQDLSKWDIRNGNNFNHMFFNCSHFDQDLSSWGYKFKPKANIRWMFKNSPVNNTKKQPKKIKVKNEKEYKRFSNSI